MNKEPFDQWAIIEVMGHQRLAGRVTEQVIGGTALVRVDVPNTDIPGFTKLLGSAAIYAMTICDEETARAMARSIRSRPMDAFSARHLLSTETRSAFAPSFAPLDEE